MRSRMDQATILVVDDDLEFLEVLREYLTRQGFHVVTAANGVEAMFQVTRHIPKAVILDLFMPRLGGLTGRLYSCGSIHGGADNLRRITTRWRPGRWWSGASDTWIDFPR